MMIHEVSKLTGLTKKAIEYYTLQNLVTPLILENGYRDYKEEDIDLLNKICVLRKLDISTDEISMILSDKTNTAIHKVCVRKELEFQQETMKKAILEKLSSGSTYAEISMELRSLDKSKKIADKLIDAFPGYFGRLIFLHFSRFLNEPILTKVQQSAFDTIISFLDNIPSLELAKDLEEYLIEATKHIGTKQTNEIVNSVKKSIENPDEFLANNNEVLEQYLVYKQSDEYKNSPAARLMGVMREYYSSSGYYEVFIPAMKQLSRTYSEYYRQSEIANEKLLAKYPEIAKLNMECKQQGESKYAGE